MSKCIFLAAGKGNRLLPYTKNLPKCLLELRDRPLISYLVKLAEANGLDEIVIVRGANGDKINLPKVKYIENTEGHNMLHSLFCAEAELDKDVVVSYTDILYEPFVMKKLLASTADISIIVDIKWEEYYRARADNPFSIAESLVMESSKILKIGTPIEKVEDVQGQYIGLIKFSAVGARQLKECYWKNRKRHLGKPWQQSQKFESAYLTDILQALIDDGITVTPVIIEKGWLEFDTKSDYERTILWERDGSLSRFINMKSLEALFL